MKTMRYSVVSVGERAFGVGHELRRSAITNGAAKTNG
jgi:hypothetical protein